MPFSFLSFSDRMHLAKWKGRACACVHPISSTCALHVDILTADYQLKNVEIYICIKKGAIACKRYDSRSNAIREKFKDSELKFRSRANFLCLPQCISDDVIDLIFTSKVSRVCKNGHCPSIMQTALADEI
jgi:hypothetical protein